VGWLRVAAVALCALAIVACKRRTASVPEFRDAALAPELGGAAVLPELRDGDVIFQESRSAQSDMVAALTGSRWTHLGVIFLEPTGPVVLEAVSPVRKTPLKRWIARGRGGEYVVKRLRDADSKLSPNAIANMKKLGATWLGRPYDLRFRWDDETLYCSELAYKLFERAANVRLGKLERARDMNLDDERVQHALRKRFGNARFDPAEIVITPDSIFNDDQLIEIQR
jgi:hypothetical protein